MMHLIARGAFSTDIGHGLHHTPAQRRNRVPRLHYIALNAVYSAIAADDMSKKNESAVQTAMCSLNNRTWYGWWANLRDPTPSERIRSITGTPFAWRKRSHCLLFKSSRLAYKRTFLQHDDNCFTILHTLSNCSSLFHVRDARRWKCDHSSRAPFCLHFAH